MRVREFIRSLDWILVGASLLLVLLGLAMLFSATYSQEGLLTSRFSRQCISAVLALVIGFFIARVPYHVVQRYAPFLYGAGIVGLIVVFFTAQIIRGTASRLSLFGFQLQPSEFAKISIVLMLAWFLARHERLRWRTVVLSGLLIGLPVALILLEPDLGVAATILAVWGLLLVFSGISWIAVGGLGAVAVGIFWLAWKYFFAEYQKSRLRVFLDPTSDQLGAGYNIVQSIVALGSGRWFGRGLGHGPQSQLKFLPEQHTDFILASIGEELGFVGVAVVIILYVVVLSRILVIARATRDPFGQLLAIGAFLLLLISFMVSAGMNMGLLPVTGIPLPLVSYGGSNLLSTFIVLALVQSVHVYSKWVQSPPTEISHFR